MTCSKFRNYAKFTMGNTHKDYMITQLICRDEHIQGVIDFTGSCVYPLVWEIIRSYVYLSPKCENGAMDTEEFAEYVKTYTKYYRLHRYDLENMGKMFFCFTAVCDFYGQYFNAFTPNRRIYLQQALFLSKLLRWLDGHIQELSERLCALADELETKNKIK